MKQVQEIVNRLVKTRGYLPEVTGQVVTINYVNQDGGKLITFFHEGTSWYDFYANLDIFVETYGDDFIMVSPDLTYTQKNVDKILEKFGRSCLSKIFFSDELRFDPTLSPLVPRHRLATSSEMKELSKKSVNISSLPKLRLEDFICRWYGFRLGDLISIEREDEIYFRVVA